MLDQRNQLDHLDDKHKVQFRAVAPPWEFFDGQTPPTERCMRCGLPHHVGRAVMTNTCPVCAPKR